MKWLEIVELRSVNQDRNALEAFLRVLVRDIEKQIDPENIQVYNRMALDGDFSIHLYHQTDFIEEGGSALGLNLSTSLREYGLVNHSIWIEMAVTGGGQSTPTVPSRPWQTTSRTPGTLRTLLVSLFSSRRGRFFTNR